MGAKCMCVKLIAVACAKMPVERGYVEEQRARQHRQRNPNCSAPVNVQGVADEETAAVFPRVSERLRMLVERYLSEYGCPIAYAEEITEGILDNFTVSFKTPPEGQQRVGSFSRCMSGSTQNLNDTRRLPVSSDFRIEPDEEDFQLRMMTEVTCR